MLSTGGRENTNEHRDAHVDNSVSKTVSYTVPMHSLQVQCVCVWCCVCLCVVVCQSLSLSSLHRQLIWNMLRLPRSSLTTPSRPSILNSWPVNSWSSPMITFTYDTHAHTVIIRITTSSYAMVVHGRPKTSKNTSFLGVTQPLYSRAHN